MLAVPHRGAEDSVDGVTDELDHDAPELVNPEIDRDMYIYYIYIYIHTYARMFMYVKFIQSSAGVCMEQRYGGRYSCV